MDGYTEDDLRSAGLSPEEIAAMQEEGQPSAEGEVPTDQPTVEVPPPDKPEGDDGKGGAPAEVAAPETPPAQPQDADTAPIPPQKGEAPTPAETPPAEPAKTPVEEKPSPQPADPFAAKLFAPEVAKEAYDAALAELKKQAQDGTIDTFEYIEKVTDLKADFKAAVAVQQFAEQNNTATAGQKWQYAQDAFKSVHPEYQSPVLWGALDGMVRQLANDPEAQKLSDIGFLSLAHDKVQEALGLNKPKSDASPAEVKPADAAPASPQAPERKPALERDAAKIPPNMGGLPAAQSSQPEDEFSDINKLDGMELEAAVAALEKSNPAKYERYLRGGA